VFVILHFGEESTGDLLVLSQVILSMQLPFAVIPLIHFVSDRRRMGEFVISRRLQIAAWIVAGLIVGLNIKLVFGEVLDLLISARPQAWIVRFTIVPIFFLLGLLGYITVRPWLNTR